MYRLLSEAKPSYWRQW